METIGRDLGRYLDYTDAHMKHLEPSGYSAEPLLYEIVCIQLHSLCTHECMYACIHACIIHTYIHTYLRMYIHTYIHYITYMQACMHMHAHMHACIHTFSFKREEAQQQHRKPPEAPNPECPEQVLASKWSWESVLLVPQV